MNLKKIFNVSETGTGRILINIFGVRIRFLKKSTSIVRKKFIKFYHTFEEASQIPPAEGDLRLIQMANLEFFKKFDKFCKENDLEYWMDFGTLLGAIRHKGFIPWDDDIDVGMLRHDYEKLIQIFDLGNFADSDFEFSYCNNKRNLCFVKIRMKNCESIFVDIFPYDFYFSKLDKKGRKKLSHKIGRITANRLHFYPTVEKIRNKFRLVTEKQILKKNPVNSSENPALFYGVDYPHKHKNKVFDYETIFPLRKILFEGVEFLAPNKSELVLESIFGEYMKIPKNSYPCHSNYLNLPQNERELLESLVNQK